MNPANVPFYEAHGLSVRHEVRLGAGGTDRLGHGHLIARISPAGAPSPRGGAQVLGHGQRGVPGQGGDDVGDGRELAGGDRQVAGHPALDLPVRVPGRTARRPRLLDRLVAVARPGGR